MSPHCPGRVRAILKETDTGRTRSTRMFPLWTQVPRPPCSPPHPVPATAPDTQQLSGCSLASWGQRGGKGFYDTFHTHLLWGKQLRLGKVTCELTSGTWHLNSVFLYLPLNQALSNCGHSQATSPILLYLCTVCGTN